MKKEEALKLPKLIEMLRVTDTYQRVLALIEVHDELEARLEEIDHEIDAEWESPIDILASQLAKMDHLNIDANSIECGHSMH